MVDMNWVEYLDPKLLFLIVFIYIIGMFIKSIERIPNKFIPLLLWGVAIVVSIIFYVMSPEVTATGECIFNGIIQGTFVAGIAVFGDQMVKQLRKIE